MYLPYKLNIDNDILKEDIFKEMKSILDKNKKALTFNEMKKQGLSYSHTVFESKCNMTFNQIITYLGYEPIGSTTAMRTKDKMLDDFHKLFKDLGRLPYTNELSIENNIANYSTYIKYFNSIRNVCDILNIDYDLYYKNNATGIICFDNNGDICRSLVERDITNYFISLGLRYDKEVYYSGIISYMGYKRMDWRLYVEDMVYYIEYFGLYHRSSKRRILKEYTRKAKYKIKKLYQHGYIDNCIFIFPNDIKTKTLDEIFGSVINKKECVI